jgi:hypothetical protein
MGARGRVRGSHAWDLPGRTPGLAGQDRPPVVQSAHVDADGHAAPRDPERHGFALVVDGISVGSDAKLHSFPSVGEGALVFVGKVLVARDAPMSAYAYLPARPGRLLDLRKGRLSGGLQGAADPVASAEPALTKSPRPSAVMLDAAKRATTTTGDASTSHRCRQLARVEAAQRPPDAARSHASPCVAAGMQGPEGTSANSRGR